MYKADKPAWIPTIFYVSTYITRGKKGNSTHTEYLWTQIVFRSNIFDVI